MAVCLVYVRKHSLLHLFGKDIILLNNNYRETYESLYLNVYFLVVLRSLYVFRIAKAVPSKISIRPHFTQVSSAEPSFKENTSPQSWHDCIFLFVKSKVAFLCRGLNALFPIQNKGFHGYAEGFLESLNDSFQLHSPRHELTEG